MQCKARLIVKDDKYILHKKHEKHEKTMTELSEIRKEIEKSAPSETTRMIKKRITTK